MHKFTPVTADALRVYIVTRIMSFDRRTIIGVDGPDAAQPVAMATEVCESVRTGGRACTVISLHDYVRPASLRFEYSREDDLSYRTNWFDFGALRREVIEPLQPDGRGTFLPRLWDEPTDRSARGKLVEAAADHVVIVAGPMILGRGLPLDLLIRLHLSPGALIRKTTEQWTVQPLITYYDDQTDKPDLTVRWDHPDRPAVSNYKVTSRARPDDAPPEFRRR